MKTFNSQWPLHQEQRKVVRFLWLPRTMITRKGGKLSQTRWLEFAKWQREAFVMENGKYYWWNDLYWLD